MNFYDLVKSKDDSNIVKGTVVETTHNLKEWKKLVKNNDPYSDVTLWDFPKKELLDGTIEPETDLIYWLINGRLYETDLTEPLEDSSNHLYFKKMITEPTPVVIFDGKR